jgi:hypothetical protein
VNAASIALGGPQADVLMGAGMSKPRHRREATWRARGIACAILALTVTACSDSKSDSPSVPEGSPSSSSSLGSGFGATYTSFAKAHDLNDLSCSGLCFDGTVVDAEGKIQARIALTPGTVEADRVQGLTLHFDRGTTLDQARTAVSALFPADASVRLARQGRGCFQVFYASPTLERQLGKGIGGGQEAPAVAFSSPFRAGFNTSNIERAVIFVIEVGAEPDC